MEKLHFVTEIHAPAHTVWTTLLDDATYREWTSLFNDGSYFEGGWEEGQTIRFLAAEDDGTVSGMLGRIIASIPDEFVAIEYLGQVVHGVDDTSSEAIAQLIGSHESYTLSESAGVTTLEVEVDFADEYVDMFRGMWPAALAVVKEIAER